MKVPPIGFLWVPQVFLKLVVWGKMAVGESKTMIKSKWIFFGIY